MSADWSTEKLNGRAFRLTDALLRASGGTTAYLQMPTTPGDAGDTGQIGVDAPNFRPLPLSPVVLRRMRRVMTAGGPQAYELLVSGSAVAAAVGQLQVASADLLFQMAAGVVVAGELFLIESVALSELMGAVYVYRLLLRESASGWQMQTQS